MKIKATLLLSIGLLLLSLPAFAGSPADVGVTRTQIQGFDNWGWQNNPLSPGTITCPGGELAFNELGIPFCDDSTTGRLHLRDAVLWSCMTANDFRITGVGLFTFSGNFDANSSGPVWGKWTIVPMEGCDKDGFYPEEQVMTSTMSWHGTWNGERQFHSDVVLPYWIGELSIVGKGSGGIIDGLHFKGMESATTYTPFPIPYELLPIPGLFDVPEGFFTGTIKE